MLSFFLNFNTNIGLIQQKVKSIDFLLRRNSRKKYADELENNKQVFADKTATRKNPFITMLTAYGVKQNDHFYNAVQRALTMEASVETLVFGM